MFSRWPLALGLVLLTSCTHDTPSPPPPPAAPKPAVAPVRGAADDQDLRVMLSELASSRACAMIRGNFQGLRTSERPDVVSGVLWIRECQITNEGAHVTFHVTGNGWLWVDQTEEKSGATFAVHQYVRFRVGTTIRGALDMAYDRKTHVATIWFTPDRTPEVEFATIGDVDVAREDVWSSVVGVLGTVFTSSPDEVAQDAAKLRGTQALAARLANGLAVTVNLCTGLQRVQLGRSAKGVMAPPDVGETRRAPVEVQAGGVMIIGPQDAENGMTLQAEAQLGAVRLTLVCAKHAETVANEFMAGRITSTVPVLGTVDVRTKSRLAIKPTSCPVVVVVSPLDNAPARFAWERPTAEIARSTGGPLIHCAKPTKTAPKTKTPPQKKTAP